MEAMLGQSRRGVNPKSGQVTVQTQPPLAGQETNSRSVPYPLVFLENAKCVHSFSAKLEDDRGMFITGLTIDKEQMFVVDNRNNRTKTFTHKGQFKFDIKVNTPWDVAVSQTGHLYITSQGDRCVKVYSIRGKQVTTMGQGQLEWPRGITLNRKGHVMVCDGLTKSIFTFHADSGQLLNNIPLSMCEYPEYITVNSVNDNIVISDLNIFGRNCVHVLSPTGDHLYQYDGSREGSELSLPHGVCTDSYGHIFIADWGNHRIVALSPQGQFIRNIVTRNDGLKYPRALAINPAGELVVGEQGVGVKSYKYIQLKQGHFSEGINRQDPLLQEAYRQANTDGFERVKRVRVMLLGHYGAGKTHLRKRLLGKEYDEDKDPITNGIETDYVLVKEGWNSDEAECHGPAISHLLAVNTKKIHEEILASHAELQPLGQVVEATNVPTSEKVEKSTSKSPEMQSDVIQEKIIAVAPKLEDENTLSTGGQISATQDKEREHQPSPSSSKETLSYLKTEESMELPPDVLTHLTESSYDIENPPPRLAVWDFGGQSVYYNTHHTFLSSRAIYILAIDMSLALTDRLDDQWHGAEHFSGTILDFTYYWIDAIHTYAQQQNMSEDGVTSPRIIIACTHKDKYLENVPKEKHEEEINAYFDRLRQHIQQKRSGVHVDPRFFAIDNTCQDEDQEISDLRRYIMKIAESQKSWGEKNPIRWIRLEEDLQLRRAPEKRGKRWIRYEELQNLALKVGMQDAIEVKSFLQFHHDIGDLMHFQTDDLSDTVILNPTWLIDAFKSIIAVDKHHVKAKGTPYWSALKRGILDERLLDELWGDDIELKSIVIGVMVQFNILLQQDVKPGTTEKPTSGQFYVPSLLPICKNPESGVGSEGTLFIQGKENFMPHVLFSRLTVKLVQNDTSSGRKGLRRRGDFFLFQNELYYDYAVYVIDPLRRALCALRKSTKSSHIELIPLYPATTKFDRTIRGAYAKWKNHVLMQIQQVKQTICPHLQLEWCVRDPRKPKIRDELMAIDPKETDLTACGLPEDSVYRLWFMPDSSEKEYGVIPPAMTLSSYAGGNRHSGIQQEQGTSESFAQPQPRHSASQVSEKIGTTICKYLFKTSKETSDQGESSLMGYKFLVYTTPKERRYKDNKESDHDDDGDGVDNSTYVYPPLLREGTCDRETDEDHENKEEHKGTSSPSVSSSVAHGRFGQKQSHEEGVMDYTSDKKSLRSRIETVFEQNKEILKRLETLEAKEERRGRVEEKVVVLPIVRDQLRQGPISGRQREQQGDANYQTSGNLVHDFPPLPVTEARRKSGHDFPPLPPQQDPVAAGDQDQGVTDPQNIRTMGNQAHLDNQLERVVTQGVAGALGQTPANTVNTHITLNVQVVNHNYSTDKESVAQRNEKDVTATFHKHVPPHVKKRLNETLSQEDVWNQVKKMYGISEENPCTLDIVYFLLSQVEGSIASFISVLLKLKERHKKGQQDIPQALVDEVKEGLLSEMEYNKLREKVVDFAEDLSIYIGRVLDHLYQFHVIPDEETTKLKNDGKRNPQDACRDLFKALLATSPKKEPIKHLKAAFRDSGLWYLADELEVSYQDVEDELQKHGGGQPS